MALFKFFLAHCYQSDSLGKETFFERELVELAINGLGYVSFYSWNVCFNSSSTLMHSKVEFNLSLSPCTFQLTVLKKNIVVKEILFMPVGHYMHHNRMARVVGTFFKQNP